MCFEKGDEYYWLNQLIDQHSVESLENNENKEYLLQIQYTEVETLLNIFAINPDHPAFNIENPVLLACENGLNDIFMLLLRKKFVVFDSINLNFEAAVENGRFFILKQMMSLCSPEFQQQLIQHTDYYALYWSFKNKHLDCFFYLCYLSKISQKELFQVIPSLYNCDEYVNIVTLIHHFCHKTSFDNSSEINDSNLIFMSLDYL